MRERIDIEAVGRILLAAAHADRHVEATEVDRITEILGQLWAAKGPEPGPLPGEILARLSSFDPSTFDLAAAAQPFLEAPFEVKHRLIELACSVHDADGELDYAEDTFIRQLGHALGLHPAQYQDLVLEVLPATTPPPPPAPEPAPSAPVETATATATEPVTAVAKKAAKPAKKKAAPKKAKAAKPAKKKARKPAKKTVKPAKKAKAQKPAKKTKKKGRGKR